MTTLRGTRLLVGCLLAALSISGCQMSNKDADGASAGSDDGFEEASDGDDLAAEAGGDEEGDLDTEQAVDQSLADEELDGDLAGDNKQASAAPADKPDDGELSLDDDAPAASVSSDIAKEELDGELDLGDGKRETAAAPEAIPSQPPVTLNTPETPEPEFNTVPAIDNAITNLRYLSKKDGGTVMIETSEPATYRTREVAAQNQVVIEIANARLPAQFKRPYVTKDFNQPIASINAYQDEGSSTVRVVVQFKGPMGASVKQAGKALTVAASGDMMSSVASDDSMGGAEGGDDSGAMGNGGMSGGTRSVASEEDGDARILPSSSVDPTGSDNVRFYGKPISIEVRDTPVRDVINLIAEQSGANLVLAGEVDGSISLKLRQIPWDQALLIVMKTRSLGYVRQGSILRIMPLESLRKETESAKLVLDAQRMSEPLRVKVIPVGYAKVDELVKQLEPFLTTNRGKIVADKRTNSLVVTDTPDVLERIKNLSKALDLPPLQVLIEGKVVEAREAFNREFGIRWGVGGGEGLNMGSATLQPDFRVGQGNDTPRGGAVFGLDIGTLDIFGAIDATLALAEREDLIKVVSSPKIVALNNEQAHIVQTTSIPVRQNQVMQGVVTTTTSYKELNMKLEVTPQVTSENDVLMNIMVVREFAGNRVPGQDPDINKREAKTKVLIRNGQTAVIGGVYQSDATQNEVGVPWLRHVPVIGWLFKNRAHNQEKSELLVFLTPRILNSEKSMSKESNL